jgi:hypothetical protein
MTPVSQTIFSLLLFCALVALQKWLNRRHRISQQVRKEVSAASRQRSGVLRPVLVRNLVYRFNSRSARNQSSQSEPPWCPRASQ